MKCQTKFRISSSMYLKREPNLFTWILFVYWQKSLELVYSTSGIIQCFLCHYSWSVYCSHTIYGDFSTSVDDWLFHIYIIITKNIRYLLWNGGFWRSLNNTYPLFLTPCIRCTNHLCDSCDLTDVNPHFIPSLLRMIPNIDLLWRHRYKSRPPAIVTSQWPIVPAWLLWTLS